MTYTERIQSRVAKGQCGYCYRPLQPGSKSRCAWHLMKQRSLVRRKAGYKPGYVTGKGRPAITRLPLPDQTQFTQAA